MSEGPLHFTLRRLQAMAFSPRFWATILTVAVMLGVVGPFGTFSQMPFLPRIGYWLAVALMTYVIGYVVIGLILGYYLPGQSYRGARILFAGFVAAVPITASVALLNTALFADPHWVNGDLTALFINVALISSGISFLYDLIQGRDAEEKVTASAEPDVTAAAPSPTVDTTPLVARPQLIERLPTTARGRLTYMSMQDHYVDVHTDRGSALILLRLADAMRETTPVAGVQIHRSHWVALDAVQDTQRKDGKLYVKMNDGALLPVSRGFQAAAREAGIFKI
ncbi:DNA-binding LytR/AlgR family response regulator [Mesorhizobium soli]|uniref:LytTR family DNA-binding domain-containing protein n=1 Tax=Pseudaminobacter soli (ex Li et al. 2025) TaxID=1295366 RepID=UPI00247616F5|nr:LytTR family DNA-binding domain-containing protein [Mesorhizobium soli]MDH6230601.1 DNA-binding LytR/AlgR family response regulator [Mesorhizobium soli]